MDDLSRYFDILEVPRGASLEEIKRAYRDLAQVWHPDRYGHNPRLRSRAEEKLKSINEAYQRLSACPPHSYTYAPSASQTSPPSPPHPSAPRDRSAEAREAGSPPRSAPPPSQTASQAHPTPTADRAPDQSTRSPRGARFLAFLTIAVLVFGCIVLAWPPRRSTPLSSTPAPTSRLPPTTTADYEQLARIKVQIRDRVARKDAEFNRLQQWYQKGVAATDDAEYRAALEKARRDEQEIAALILAYNAAKRILDARNPSP